jgi:hypothetical protein
VSRGRRLAMARAAGKCERCGRAIVPGYRSLHHRRPRGMGGSRDPLTDHPANFVDLCGSGTTDCHGDLESFRLLAKRFGWILPQGSDPRTCPVRIFRPGWERPCWMIPGPDRWYTIVEVVP